MVDHDFAKFQAAFGAIPDVVIRGENCAPEEAPQLSSPADFMYLAAEEYAFGDHAYLRFVERIKDAVDPQGILAPGKQGIWPERLRGG